MQLPELELAVLHKIIEYAPRRDLSSAGKVSLNSSKLWVDAINVRRGGDTTTTCCWS